MDRELNRIYCLVALKPYGNRALFDEEKLSKELTNATIKYLKQYGIRCVAEQPNPRGGDWGAWGDTLRYLWENKDYIMIPMAILRGMKDQYRSWIFKKYRQERPTATIHFKIRIKQQYEGYDYHCPNVDGAMMNLKYLADEAAVFLAKKYPLFVFDQTLGLSICQRQWRINLRMRHKQLNKLNNARIIRQLSALRVKDGTNLDFSITCLGFIKRVENAIQFKNGFWISEAGRFKGKRYYTVISTRVIRDYI